MSRIRSPWTPPSSDNTSNEHVLGFDFVCDVPFTLNGGWWWQAGGAPPANIRQLVWVTNTQTLVADSGTVSTTGWTNPSWNGDSVTVPFAGSAGTTYTLGFYFIGSYQFSSTDLSTDQVSADGHMRALAHTGRFINSAGPVFPTSTWDGMFGTDLDYTIGGATVDMSAALSGTGSLTAAVDRFGNLAAALSGTGFLTATFGRLVVARPNTGTVTRPFTGTVTRP